MATFIDHLMKNKNEDGSWTILYPISKTKNIKTTENIEVKSDNDIGSFKNGQVINAGTSIDSIITNLVQVRSLPEYKGASVTCTPTESSTIKEYYEDGETINVKLTSSFTQNDAGELNNIVFKANDGITYNNSVIGELFTSPATLDTTVTISNKPITITATASYQAGPVKQDNFGDDCDIGKIEAGTKSSDIIELKSYHKYFYASDKQSTAVATSDDVRSLNISSSVPAVTGITEFDINVTSGDTRVTFAYPSHINPSNTSAECPVQRIEYVEGGYDCKNLFTKTTINVANANNQSNIEYFVYTFIPSQAFPSNMTFHVTL